MSTCSSAAIRAAIFLASVLVKRFFSTSCRSRFTMPQYVGHSCSSFFLSVLISQTQGPPAACQWGQGMETPAVSESKTCVLFFCVSFACIRHYSPRLGRSCKTGLGCPLRESHSPEDLSGLPPLRDPGLTGAVAGQGYHCGSDEVMAGMPATAPLGPDGYRSPPYLPL